MRCWSRRTSTRRWRSPALRPSCRAGNRRARDVRRCRRQPAARAARAMGGRATRCRPLRVAASDVVPGSIDFEFNTLPTRIAERYALIVSYHYCHPADTWLKGTKSITPEELDAQLRVAHPELRLHDDGRADEPVSRSAGDGRRRHLRRRVQGRRGVRAAGAAAMAGSGHGVLLLGAAARAHRAQRAPRAPAAGASGPRSVPSGVRGAVGVATAGRRSR